MSSTSAAEKPTLFGHPTGLFTLFFAEMWERFSYYGMRALLVLYMIKGFLGYGDSEAYVVYGAYTSLVYMTPFFGGMLADRVLGARRAVILGGLLMAGGHLLMTIEAEYPFFMALALLIVGNGFFKPNISTIVGSLYEPGDTRRDGGFTLFYIGINLGAAMAPLLCGYIGETYGWHYGFGLATVGMLIGLGVFIVPTRVAQILIVGGALATGGAMVALQDSVLLLVVNGFVALALVVSAFSAFAALGRGGLPEEAGQPKDLELLNKPIGPITLEYAIYIGALVVTPILGVLVLLSRTVRIIPEAVINQFADSGSGALELVGFILGEMSTPAGLILAVAGLGALFYLLKEAIAAQRVERDRLFVVITLMFFSLLFWAFFEQAGSSVNNFTDRNVDRVAEEQVLTEDDVGSTLTLTVTQEQLGHVNGDRGMYKDIVASLEKKLEEIDSPEKREKLGATIEEVRGMDALTLTGLDALREAEKLEQPWKVVQSNVGMGTGGNEIPASTFQSANPIYILIFGLVFTALWTVLGRMGLEPSTPVKFALGLVQLGLGFAALWYGASMADPRGMVAMQWLLIGYLLHTTGELCLSPVGLSMVTRLSPTRLVSTVMGAWFLATAFSNYLAGVIAALTGVGHGGGGSNVIPVPAETVHVYGGVFGNIALAAILSGVVLFLISPLLKRGMHPDAPMSEGAGH